jgi:hypothetical protein
MVKAKRQTRQWAAIAAPCVLWALALAPGAGAQPLFPSDVELEDVLEIEIMSRDVLAFDAMGSGSRSFRLDIGEEIVWSKAAGRIGVVATTARLMGVSADGGGWSELRYGVHETPPERILMGTRVALTVTDKRIIGFDSRVGGWLVRGIGPHETVRVVRVGAGTGVVITDRTAYGLSPDAGGFLSIPMRIHETLDSVRVSANMATVNTSKRLLVFRAPAGAWSVEDRPLH